MIKEINYNGKMVKCEVTPCILSIVLLLFCIFLIPIYMIIIKAYFLAGLFHFLSLLGIFLSKGTVLKNYVPVKE